MLQGAYEKELLRFDRERVLPAWDGLLARQQAKLEALGVPNMFVTTDPREREVRRFSVFIVFLSLINLYQQQNLIVQVLIGLVGNG